MNDIFITYPGGKNGSGVCQQLINLMPPHRIYIEPFLGGGAVMRTKRPAAGNIGIDANAAVVREWGFVEYRAGIPNLQIIRADAVRWLDEANRDGRITADTLIYCDPPYLMSTRSSQRQLYTIEMAEEKQHDALIRVLRTLPCMVMLSGYWSQLYADLLPDWRTHTYQAQTRSGKPATEWVWMNYPEPFALHDYRFLGNTFRQREQIKRQKTRWLARLQSMPALKRMALLDAIQTMASSACNSDASGDTADRNDVDMSASAELATGSRTPSLQLALPAGAAETSESDI